MFTRLCGNRGAVAVFLVIILVPMITISSVFVDVARMELAKSAVASAGDLALNTLLSNYDQKLNDLYGFLASAQDMSKVTDALESYFTACLVSTGIDTTTAKKTVDNLNAIFKEDDAISDLLRISVNEGSFKVAPTANSALNNPAIVKTQLVEFMKYRAPADMALGLLEAFKNFKNNTDSTKEEVKCVEEQQDFYETEQSLLEKADEVYRKIKDYINHELEAKTITDTLKKFDSAEDDYKRVHRKFVFDLARFKVINTTNIKAFGFRHDIVADTTGHTTPVLFPIKTTYSASKLCPLSTLASKMKTVKDKLDAYDDAKKAFEKLYNDFPFDGTNPTRWLHNVTKSTEYTDYCTAATNLGTNYSQFYNMWQYCAKPEAQASATYQDYKAFIGFSYTTYLDYANSLIDRYNAIVGTTGANATKSKSDPKNFNYRDNIINQLKTKQENPTEFFYKFAKFDKYAEDARKIILNNAKSILPANTTEIPAGGATSTADADAVLAKYSSLKSVYSQCVSQATKAKEISDATKELKGLVEQYKKDFASWKTAAGNKKLDGGNPVGEKSRKEIAEIENNQELIEQLSDAKVEALVHRFLKINNTLDTMADIIEAYKYCGDKIVDIKSVFNSDAKASFEQASDAKAQKMRTDKIDSNSELNTYATSTFKFEKSDKDVSDDDAKKTIFDDGNEPDLYKWMDDRFKNTTPEKVSQVKKDVEEYEKMDVKTGGFPLPTSSLLPDSAITELKNYPSRPSAGGGVNSDDKYDESDRGLAKLVTYISGVIDTLTDGLDGAATAVRDDLYTVDYVMSMFSHDTYNLEGMLDLWADDSANAGKSMQLDCFYQEQYKEAWKSDELIDTYNKSLTNQKIDINNNYSFGNEVEYVLYGGANAANKAKAYSIILALRVALNLAPVIQKFYDLVFPIASGLSALTAGIIPAPVIQVIICVALTFCEAAIDMVYIHDGIGVNLIKKDLFIDFTDGGGLSLNSSADLTKITGNTGLCWQYSDYLKLFLFLGFLGPYADSMYLRIADVVQANVTEEYGEAKGAYKLSKSFVYYTVSGSVKVEPIMLGLPIISDEIDATAADGLEKLEKSPWNSFTFSVTRGY